VAIREIRELIADALRREAETGALHRELEQRVTELGGKLLLPEDEPVAALMSFVTSYIRSVPSCLRLVAAVSTRQGFYDYAAPFLHLAEDYFLSPPEELQGHGGLGALLDEAFLAHRLLEEVNDHHIRHLRRPLLPVDMTEANIIVHHLLGDRFATRLEQLVQFTAAQLLNREYVWDEARRLSAAPAGTLVSTARIAGSEPRVRLRLAS